MSKKDFFYLLFFTTVFIGSILLYEFVYNRDIEKYKSTTSGLITDIDTTISRSGGYNITIEYTYRANRIKYDNFTQVSDVIKNCPSHKDCFNKKYVVEYSTKNPQHSRILLDKPLEDTVSIIE